jgi:hypothetical protein
VRDRFLLEGVEGEGIARAELVEETFVYGELRAAG